jgi:dienelactone hydrolase
MVRTYHERLFSREQMTRPFLSLAGLRIEPDRLTHSRAPLGIYLRVNSIDNPSDAKELHPPQGAYFGEPDFSPGGTKLAIPLYFEKELKMAVYDVEDGGLRELATPALSAVWGPPCSWMNEEQLLCFGAGENAEVLSSEPGPRIYELKSGAAPARTYSGLLQGAADDALFERYARVRLLVLGAASDEVEALSISGLITSAAVSPNGEYVLLTRVAPPYSRLVPASLFPVQQVVYRRATGEVVHSILTLPARTTTGVPYGPRAQAWNPKAPAELYYVERIETLGGGAQEHLYRISAPFSSPSELLSDTLRRVSYLGFTTAGEMMLTDTPTGKDWTSYRLTPHGLDLLHTSAPSDPIGDPSQSLRENGTSGPVLESQGALFFSREVRVDGRNVRELLRWDSNTKTQKRVLFGNQGEHMEILGVLDPSRFEYLTTIESPESPPRVVVTRAGRRRTVTQSPAQHPELSEVTRRDLRIRRADGVTMPATLFLPPGFHRKKPVPTVIWIYPRQFPDSESAELSTEGADRYFEVGGPSRLSVLTQGYALLDLPAVPIVGELKTGRDDFVPQLISGAEAAVEKLVEIGVTERERVYPMGRSYGAFAVANLLAHSRIFRTGIAMNGAYNRTLTPFGFQHETTTFWENTEAYINVSPFFFAHEIEGSLLLIHGEQDENAGTPILQSERFYAALVGNGVRARYVALPYEGHQFRGRDGVLHATAEVLLWLDANERELAEERRKRSR